MTSHKGATIVERCTLGPGWTLQSHIENFVVLNDDYKLVAVIPAQAVDDGYSNTRVVAWDLIAVRRDWA